MLEFHGDQKMGSTVQISAQRMRRLSQKETV